MTRNIFYLLILVILLGASAAKAGVSVSDDTGYQVNLNHPASRIVSLAPHVTELLFAVGAGDVVVGAVEYSDYPDAAKLIPRVGSYHGGQSMDLERILILKPDLVVAWQSGNGVAVIEKMRQLGLNVYVTEPREFEQVAVHLERLGVLTGNADTGKIAATDFRQQINRLRNEYSERAPVKMFYQIWHQPLMTINGEHLIGKVIKLCGGDNIFASLPSLAPQVDVEAVVLAAPDVIIASGMAHERPQWLEAWQQWPDLPAVANGHTYVIHPDILQRHTPRIAQGAAEMCRLLERGRQAQ